MLQATAKKYDDKERTTKAYTNMANLYAYDAAVSTQVSHSGY